MVNKVQLRQSLFDFFREKDLKPSSTENLFESGAIDSMEILELISFMEDTIGVQLDMSKITADNFCTIDDIVELFSKIEKK